MIFAVLYIGPGAGLPQAPTSPMPATATAAPPAAGHGSWTAPAVFGRAGLTGVPGTAATGRRYCTATAATSTATTIAAIAALRTS